MNELPSGWAQANLGRICNPIYGRGLRKDLRNETGGYAVYGSAGVAGHHDKSIVEGPVLIVGRKGNAGEVHFSAEACWPIDTTYYLKLPGGLDPKFVALQLRYLRLGQLDSSTAVPSLRREDLENSRLVIPPFAEQRRIVSDIEEHFSRLDAAEASLSSAAARLSILEKQIVDEAWTMGFPTSSLEDVLAEPLANGKSVPTDPEGFPVLRLTALRNRRIDLTERKGGAWTAEEAASCVVKRGDFLISRGNGSLSLVGRGGLVSDDPDPVAYPDTLIRARPQKHLCMSEYLALVWDSQPVRRRLESLARTTAGIYKVNQKMLQKIEFPLPSVPEQARFVGRVSSQLDQAAELTHSIGTSAARTQSTRRSILIAAFTGRLVPQDDADEPAALLLSHIAAERPVSKTSRKKKAAS